MSMIVHYDEAGNATHYVPQTPDSDEDPGVTAQALDAVIDATADALAEGNVAQAQALVTAADATSDVLLDELGVADADDPGDDAVAG